DRNHLTFEPQREAAESISIRRLPFIVSTDTTAAEPTPNTEPIVQTQPIAKGSLNPSVCSGPRPRQQVDEVGRADEGDDEAGGKLRRSEDRAADRSGGAEPAGPEQHRHRHHPTMPGTDERASRMRSDEADEADDSDGRDADGGEHR